MFSQGSERLEGMKRNVREAKKCANEGQQIGLKEIIGEVRKCFWKNVNVDEEMRFVNGKKRCCGAMEGIVVNPTIKIMRGSPIQMLNTSVRMSLKVFEKDMRLKSS